MLASAYIIKAHADLQFQTSLEHELYHRSALNLVHTSSIIGRSEGERGARSGDLPGALPRRYKSRPSTLPHVPPHSGASIHSTTAATLEVGIASPRLRRHRGHAPIIFGGLPSESEIRIRGASPW